MKKIALFRKDGDTAEFVDRFDNVEEASDAVKEIINEDEDANVFDFYTEEQEYTDVCERVKSYADACNVLCIVEMDEQAMKASGFRPDEIARRKLETITEALNEGWRPDWNNTDEPKYYPWFYIRPHEGKDAEGKPSGAYAGLSCASTYYAASNTNTTFGSRLCFHERRTAAYAGDTFRDLYAQILVENF